MSKIPKNISNSGKKLSKDIDTSIMRETAVLYKRDISPSIISEKAPRPEWQMTAVEKMEMMREGISKQNLETLKARTNLDYDKLSALLSTTRATLINKKGKEQFSEVLGERIISIAEIYSFGYSVFENAQNFREWVFRPNQGLGGKPPFELMDSHFGREEVKNLIGRIDYGVYS